MRALLISLFILFVSNAKAIDTSKNTYQPQWEMKEIKKVNSKVIAVVTTPLKFCADQLIQFNFEITSDVHGPILVVTSLVKDNSRFKIFCMGLEEVIEQEIVIKDLKSLEGLELINDYIHF